MLEKHQSIFNTFRKSIVFVLFASTIVNVLVLTSPFFMLLLYDKAVPSSSVETLGVLTLLAILLFSFYGLFDYLRGRVLARIGARIQTELDEEFLVDLNTAGNTKKVQDAIRDLEKVKTFMSSPVAVAVIDIFWSPLFIIVAFIFNAWLGWFSVISVIILTALAIANQRINKKRLEDAQKEGQIGENYAREYLQNSTIITALGMKIPLAKRWLHARESATTNQIDSADWVGAFSSLSKSLRLMAQSGMLALGAFLAIKNQIPPGMMIAGSILLGRTLAPIDQVIGQWRAVEDGYRAWKSVNAFYDELSETAEKTQLPAPKGHIRFNEVYVTYGNPRNPVLTNINFEVKPGQALGVIGPSASGKSSLALALLGVLPTMSGRIEIDGASINQYDQDSLGRYFGYLPQEVSLLTGTIAENIARFEDGQNRDEMVVEAAKAAGAHQLITEQAQGYNTTLPGALSGGQKQRVALARALYGEPPILLYDEPNSNLDAEGTAALNRSILDAKNNGKTVIIVAHRPAAIQECDLLLMLNQGRVQDFGPRDEVLERQVKNFKVIKGAQNAQ